MRATTLVLLCAALSCGAPSTVPTARPAETVYDVNWLALCRDHETAASYTGHTVRVRLAASEYSHEGGELRVWAGLRNAPPILIFTLSAPPPGPGPLVVVGVCRRVARDGVWRSPRADYCVHFDGATATAP